MTVQYTQLTHLHASHKHIVYLCNVGAPLHPHCINIQTIFPGAVFLIIATDVKKKKKKILKTLW